MKPAQLSTFLQTMFAARLPVLITGAPGGGKSEIATGAAAAIDADLILSHPAVSDPTDAKGLPFVAEGGETATFLPFGELSAAMKATRPTVWFLDDLGQAPAAVQASFMQLILARRVNGHCLPECVTFVAATNRRTDRAGVTGILEPVKSRFAAIVELESDVDDWSRWAASQPWFPAVLLGFIRFRPELLSKFTPSADLTNSPTPRTWSNAARLFNLGLPQEIESEAIAGAVGEAAANEFLAFVKLFRQLPSIDGILLDPDHAPIPDGPGVLYAVTAALASKANPVNFGRVATYAERLLNAGHGEFASLLVRDSTRRTPEIQSTAEFIRLASGEFGQLISGGVGL